MRSAVWLGVALLCCSGGFLFAQETGPADAGFSGASASSDAGPDSSGPDPAKDSVNVISDSEPLINPEDVMNGGNLVFQQQDEPVLVSPDAAAYQFYITDMENRHGAYAPGLSEQLPGLGSVYQEQGLHQEAIKVFKRAVHLSRINRSEEVV